MGEGVNLAFYAWVVIEGIAIEVTELKGIPLMSGVSIECGKVGFNKGRSLEDYQALKMLDNEHYVLVINFFAHKYYLIFLVHPIKVGVEVAQVGLISPLC